ncbi:VWA domain-containing protein [Actinoplanes sp. NPDC048796]
MIATSWLMGATPAQADETEVAPQVELVLDVSGSMRAKDIDGQTRIAVAKRAFGQVVDALPETTQLGIRVLGATYPGDDKKKGCLDTQQIVPVGPVDPTVAKAAIAALKPTGYTPIGLALRAAANDLGTGEGARRIVLITDGEDTCTPPDPCAVARQLAAQGTKLVVDTLGLTPDEKTRKQLVCISTATGGTYASAQSEQELTDRVQQLVDRAAVPPPVTPAVVTGTESCDKAPVLSPGVYSDRERIGEHRYYRVPLRAGEELRASVSVALDRPVNRDYGVLLKAATPNGRELVRGLDAASGRADVISAGLRWSFAEDEETAAVCLIVSNSFASATSAGAPGMPLELSIDTVAASTAPDAPGLGRGWLLLLVLAVAGLIAGVLAGWLTRWWVATWREN